MQEIARNDIGVTEALPAGQGNPSFAAGDDVAEVPLAEADATAYATSYFIAPVQGADAKAADLAAEFVTLVTSNEAFDLFTEAGFGGIVRE